MTFNLKALLVFTLILVTTGMNSNAWATEIYVYKDKDGNVQLTDKPKHKGFQLVTGRNWKHKPMTSLDTASFSKNRERRYFEYGV